MVIQKKLSNGIRIIAEPLPQYRSVAMGVWVGTGSVRENENEAGISHFIEHMLFKGTERRSASDLAAEMDSIGGNFNAFTAKECTCFYVKVLDENLEIGADILSDILLHSTFDPAEMAKEKGVVAEEILMCEDTPEDLVHEVLCSVYYGDSPLSKPIIGTKESVESFTPDDLRDYMRRHYTPDNIVIACAGNFEEKALVALLEEKFSGFSGKDTSPLKNSTPVLGRVSKFVKKDVEQVHICLGLPGVALDAPGQYTLAVLNNALGGSMSSRLFQNIREKRGLAYSVYSYGSAYRNTGGFTLYAGTGEKQAADVVELMLCELRALENGLTEEEFERSKRQLKGSFLMGRESTSARMNSLGKSELLLGRYRTDEERLSRIEGVTMDEVREMADYLLNGHNLAAAFVGRVDRQEKQLRSLIESY